ncbi:MAG: putative S-layer protein [Nanoarchaeota archaeon]|nr:putative S-layer protein [DPANN group archaeon]MBL7116965.1 putative S-layer protein [Nanoarchaeota archaeon]
MKKVLMFVAIFLLAILAVNAQPTLPTISDVTATEGDTVTIDINLTAGPDNGSTTWWTNFSSLTLAASSDNSSQYTWATSVGDAGTYSVRFNASDNDSSDSKTMTITVNALAWSLSLSAVTLGSSSQEREQNASATLTVTNTGTGDITGITLSTNAASVYNIGLSQTTIASLAAGASTTVTVTGYVPDDHDAGVDNLGTITATGTGGGNTVTATSTLSMQAENNLVIRDVDVTVNGDDTNLDDGDDVKVYPAAEIEMTIELKNTHSTIDIEDIEITVEGESDLDDIDEDDDISKIKDGKKDTVTFSFTIDKDASEDTYDITITVEGEDENGATHGEIWTIEFDLEEEGILITKSELIPETLRCGEDSFDLRLELSNVGTKDEDDAAVEIVADTLNYEKRVSNLQIDEDDEITRTYTIPVPDNADSGVHVIEIKAFQDFDEQTHKKYVYFTVPSGCFPEEEEEEDTGIEVVTDGDELDEEEDLEFVDAGAGEGVSAGLEFGVWGTVLLVLANVLVLVIIVILVVKFLIRV